MKLHSNQNPFHNLKGHSVKTRYPRPDFTKKCGMSTLLIQILFMNGRNRKMDNKAKSYVCNWFSASLNSVLWSFWLTFIADAPILCLAKKYGRSVQRWEVRKGEEDSWSSSIHNFTQWNRNWNTVETHVHTQIQICRYVQNAKHSQPHSKQKCLATPPVLSWIHLYFITGFKISSYSQCPLLPPKPNKASKDAKIVFQLSWTYLHLFFTSVFQRSNLTP